jgi:hypothetical protein
VLKERHLKIHLVGDDGRAHEALWWGGAEAATATPRPGDRIELAYELELNTWRGEQRLQLIVRDVKKQS